MRLLGQILLACLLIALLQGMLAILAVGIVLALIVGLIWRPAETISLLLFLLLLKALDVHPWATIGIGGCLTAAFLIASRKTTVTPVDAERARMLPPPDASEGP